MAYVLFEYGLCLLESVIVFISFNVLLKRKLQSAIWIIMAIIACSITEYFCSGHNIFLKAVIGPSMYFLFSGILFKDKPLIKLSYSLVSVYFFI